jgi:ABC-type branched-subunit amino acid transport system ATPase component
LFREEIARVVSDIRDSGAATIIEGQDAIEVLKCSDRAAVLNGGEVHFSGKVVEISYTRYLSEKYLDI